MKKQQMKGLGKMAKSPSAFQVLMRRTRCKVSGSQGSLPKTFYLFAQTISKKTEKITKFAFENHH